MMRRAVAALGVAIIFGLSIGASSMRSARAATPHAGVAARVVKITRSTTWTPVAAIRLGFKTFHPQGMVKVGDAFFLSSVEIGRAPQMFAAPRDGHDRDAGAGVGHLFKFGADGALLGQAIVGEGDAYHPGGIDFDGERLWVPASEYRPDSRAIVYTVNPQSLKVTPVFRFTDHIGALAFDREAHRLHAVSWGSRRFYSWAVGAGSTVRETRADPTPNPSSYIDYQDCHFVGGHKMLCGGVGDYRREGGDGRFQLGGIELVDLKAQRPVWQIPLDLRSPSGRVMTQNPMFVETTARGLRAYFIPDDDDSTLFVFDIARPQ